MKTKIIPFDADIAKDIQDGKIKGRVLDKDNFEGTIITTNCVNTPLPVVVKFSFSTGDYILFFGIDGKNAKGNKLVLEVPNNKPQFKPFDKVLVRRDENDDGDPDTWVISFFMDESIAGYRVLNGEWFDQCIQYEGNEHLLGTTDEPKEE